MDRFFNTNRFQLTTRIAAMVTVAVFGSPSAQGVSPCDKSPSPVASPRTSNPQSANPQSAIRNPQSSDPQGASRSATLVIVNAAIWSGVDSPAAPRGDTESPTALAVSGDTIVAVGDDATIRALIGEDTRIIDARGRRVIPGMTDSHAHIVGGGLQLARLYLRDVRSREEFIQGVAAHVKAKQPGQWVLGGRWSVESWETPQAPRKEWLDPVTGDTPVFLKRMDGHQALVNSAALKIAGIDSSGPDDPPGGEIQRDPRTKEPTGILKEQPAMDLVWNHIAKPSTEQRYQALRRAMKHANSLGITSVHDMCDKLDLPAFKRANDDGALTVRLTVYVHSEDWPKDADEIAGSDLRSDMVRVAGIKGYMDGSLGSRTAYMRDPYTDATTETAYPRGQLRAWARSRESFHKIVAATHARGLQIAVHAIGDEANHLVLDAYGSVTRPDIHEDLYNRVEHAQHLLATDIPRFARLGVVASMQPFHKADDGRYAEKAIGKARLAGSYAFRQLADSGALLCFGSDWPVVTLNPFAGIDSAVNAKTLDGKVWLPSHSLTLEEALQAYTASPPRAVGQEKRLGTLEVGKLADIVILADDPFTIPSEQLGKVKVVHTIVGGKLVFSAAGPK